MVRREYVFFPVMAVCAGLAISLVYVAAQPSCSPAGSARGIAVACEPPQHRRAVAAPVELALGVAEPAAPGAPVTLVVSVSSLVPVRSGVLTLRVPEIGGEPNRTEVLWAGAAAENVAETIPYAVGILPPGQHEFAAILELTAEADNAAAIVLSQCLYLDVRPSGILFSSVSFEQIRRVELRRELERRIALSLKPELAIAGEDAVARELARVEAADPGLVDRRIEELQAADPDVARRIMELNEHQAEDMSSVATLPCMIARGEMDLWLERFDVGSSATIYHPRDTIVVEFMLMKSSAAQTGPWTVDIYLSLDTLFSADDYHLGSIGRTFMEENTLGQSFSETFEVPFGIPNGDYHVCGVLTCADDTNPANNRWRDFHKVEFLTVGPDLGIESLRTTKNAYRPGDRISIHTVVQSRGDEATADYNIAYSLAKAVGTPSEYPLISLDRSGLAPRAEDGFDVTCEVPANVPEGTYQIKATLVCAEESSPIDNQGFTDPLWIGPRAGLPGFVCGQATYQDTSAWIHAVRYARVKIYNADNDTDPLNDRLLAQTATDGEGCFGVVLEREQTSGPQIYVKVFTEGVRGAYPGTTSTICTVKDDVLKSLYALKSPLCPYPSETSTTVNLRSPIGAGEFMVYDSVVEGFHKTKVCFNVELDPIAAYWPSSDGGTYYYPAEGIWVARYDRGDRDVILHEYGHYVADCHGFALGSVGLNPIHYWNLDLRFYPYYRTNEEAMNLAFRESWATLFGIAVQYGDFSYPYGGDAMYQNYDEVAKKIQMLNLETDTYPACSPGQYFDNMTCCALWDIFDDQNDTRNYQDTLSDPGLVKVWTIVRDYKPMDTLDFWNSWFEKYDYRKEMLAIFGNHQIDFKYPKGSPTVATFESGRLDGFAWTTRGDAVWTVVSDISHQGTYSARAGSIQAGQSSTLEVAMTCESGRIGFWYKLSTELGGDMLNFSIDGVRKNGWSGEKDWQRIDFAVPAGAHTFTWTYRKDGSLTQGADTVWLDDIEFPVW